MGVYSFIFDFLDLDEHKKKKKKEPGFVFAFLVV